MDQDPQEIIRHLQAVVQVLAHQRNQALDQACELQARLLQLEQANASKTATASS